MKRVVLVVLAAGVVLSAQSAWGQVCPPKTFKWDGNIPIPDVGPKVFAEIVVPPDPAGCNQIADLDVDLIIQHTWQGDLLIRLEHLDNQMMNVLIDRPGVPQSTFGFSADNYGNPSTGAKMILDDGAASTYDLPQVPSPGIANVTGSWKPEQALAMYNGKNKAGVWRLSVSDHAGGDIGAIRNFSLSFQNVPEPATLALLGLGGLLGLRRRMR